MIWLEEEEIKEKKKYEEWVDKFVPEVTFLYQKMPEIFSYKCEDKQDYLSYHLDEAARECICQAFKSPFNYEVY